MTKNARIDSGKQPLTKVADASTKARSALSKRPRLGKLLTFDCKLLSDATRILIGVDEVGRGCLAGPVVAAAVILPPIKLGTRLAKSLSELDDSKALNARQREKLAAVIHSCAECAIAEASPAEIDAINIYHASCLAMSRALAKLAARLGERAIDALVLVDGKAKIRGVCQDQLPVIDGDAISASIAAASVIAKVFRDRMMCDYAREYPHYAWESNKGYGAKAHRDGIRVAGLTPLHRRSFYKALDAIMGSAYAEESFDPNEQDALLVVAPAVAEPTVN